LKWLLSLFQNSFLKYNEIKLNETYVPPIKQGESTRNANLSIPAWFDPDVLVFRIGKITSELVSSNPVFNFILILIQIYLLFSKLKYK